MPTKPKTAPKAQKRQETPTESRAEALAAPPVPEIAQTEGPSAPAPDAQRLERLENKLDLLMTWVAIVAPQAVAATLPHNSPQSLNGTAALVNGVDGIGETAA